MSTIATFDCESAREALDSHAKTCAVCGARHAREHWLSELLRAGMPHEPAPEALRERVRAQLEAASSDWQHTRLAHWLLGATAVAVLTLSGVLLWPSPTPAAPQQPLAREMLNDHLRVIYSGRPVEIEHTSLQQVAPWFTGRLDFAPQLAFSGDREFALAGGAIAYVIDRKAATLVFKRRLHTISCFVFRAQGLPWPEGAERVLDGGRVRADALALHGFHLVMWRNADLAYALVSDAGEPDLLRLGGRLAQAH